MDFFSFIASLGLKAEQAQLALAGAAGGLVRWITLRDNWLDGLASVVVGVLCAVYASPLTMPLLGPALGSVGMPLESTNGLSGFLTGIAGIALSGMIIDYAKLRARQVRDETKDGESE